MFISLIIATVSLILDIILNNFLPYMLGNLSFFTPMFTVVSLLFIYYFFRKRERHYYIFSFILGVVYDLIFTNLLFYNGILFLAISFIVFLIWAIASSSNELQDVNTALILAIITARSKNIITFFILVNFTRLTKLSWITIEIDSIVTYNINPIIICYLR